MNNKDILNQIKQRTASIRHAHEVNKIQGLSDRMKSQEKDCLVLEKAFKDLGQLKDFPFLKYLSIRELKKGIATIKGLDNLLRLDLWAMRDLNAEWLNHLNSLKYLKTYQVRFKKINLLEAHPNIRFLEFNETNGLGSTLDISQLIKLESLKIDGNKEIEVLGDFSKLTNLTHVNLSNMKALSSIESLKDAPNLISCTIQNTPNLKASDLEWMVKHKTLKDVYPALKAIKGAPILDEVTKVLSPKFGDDIFENRNTIHPITNPLKYWEL